MRACLCARVNEREKEAVNQKRNVLMSIRDDPTRPCSRRLCGYEPFYDKVEVHIFRKILKCDFMFHQEWWTDVSDNAKVRYAMSTLTLIAMLRY